MEAKKYILGLDLGIASVGWAIVLIDDDEELLGLLDFGVRTFEKAEMPERGESLSLARRLARGSRRIIRRRAHRLLRLKRLLKREGLLKDSDFSADGTIHNLPNT